MSLYRPTELRQFLKSLGIHPKKGLSQNFLVDGNIIRKIVATADVTDKDTVLEIGPGPGALTEALLATGARVIAVEQDRVLASHLGRLPGSERLTVITDDIRNVDVASLLPTGGKVVANLPYHLTTPILAMLLPLTNNVKSVTVMVQAEVGERMTAKAKSDAYGSFSVFCRYYSQARYAFTVSRRCFYPAPKVDSAVVHLELQSPPDVPADKFFSVTRPAFGKRRKMLRSTLGEFFGRELLESVLTELGIEGTARPEELSLEQFVLITRGLIVRGGVFPSPEHE